MKPWPQPSEDACFPLLWEADDLANYLRELRKKKREAGETAEKAARTSLTAEERGIILGKTGGLCHICGGAIDDAFYWEADHVLRHFAGGSNDLNNYLAAHGLCNTCRWHNSPQETQWILKIGVWARGLMEGNNGDKVLGRQMLVAFVKKEKDRERRKKQYKQSPPAKAAGA